HATSASDASLRGLVARLGGLAGGRVGAPAPERPLREVPDEGAGGGVHQDALEEPEPAAEDQHADDEDRRDHRDHLLDARLAITLLGDEPSDVRAAALAASAGFADELGAAPR